MNLPIFNTTDVTWYQNSFILEVTTSYMSVQRRNKNDIPKVILAIIGVITLGLTTVSHFLAIVFFLTSIVLGMYVKKRFLDF